MTKISMIGLDPAKNVFQVHGADAAGDAVVRPRLRRAQMEQFFGSLDPCMIGMTADRPSRPPLRGGASG